MSFYLEPPNTNQLFLSRLHSEIEWTQNRIQLLTSTKLHRKPSAVKEIRTLEYQLRHRELELTFKGPEWAKYEKYGIWESLTR
jgi:hypothetical protein